MKKLLILGLILALAASMVVPMAVGAASTTPPTISLGITNTNGLCISVNGVTLPTAPGASVTSIVWNWGDGQTMAGWFPETHTYSVGGTYNITATATDSNGQSSSASIHGASQRYGNPNYNYLDFICKPISIWPARDLYC